MPELNSIRNTASILNQSSLYTEYAFNSLDSPMLMWSSTIDYKSKKISRQINSRHAKSENPQQKCKIMYLIALALKNSDKKRLQAYEIVDFVRSHFPYFETNSKDWSKMILTSLSNCNSFKKIELRSRMRGIRTKYLWTFDKLDGLNLKFKALSLNNFIAIKKTMANPANFDAMMKGKLKFSKKVHTAYNPSLGSDSEDEFDSEMETDIEQILDDNYFQSEDYLHQLQEGEK